MKKITVTLLFLTGGIVMAIPPHPQKLEFPELQFSLPNPDDITYTIDKNVSLLIAEDHSLPLVHLSLIFRGGSYLDPEGKTGLATLTAKVMRTGGTKKLTPEEFDEKADFLAANISTSVDSSSFRAYLNCLSSVFDECLELFFKMLKEPRFDKERLKIEKTKMIEELKQRNDHPQSILWREWNWLVYGKSHPEARQTTKAEIESITQNDLFEFWKKITPENGVIAVVGDIDASKIKEKIAKMISDWPNSGNVKWPPEEKTKHLSKPGIYVIEKEIPQTAVAAGHRTFKMENWLDKSNFAITVMNEILGGGFNSRLFTRIRSDEGLAYAVRSIFRHSVYWPGTFIAFFQSKNETAAYATKLLIEELEKMRTDNVTSKELKAAKQGIIDRFPQRFETLKAAIWVFAEDKFIGRPFSFWKNYRNYIEEVTADAVKKAANDFIHPEKSVIVMVGKWSEIDKWAKDKNIDLRQFGPITHLPLRDPLTLEPVKQ